jgi:hypothetical protein
LAIFRSGSLLTNSNSYLPIAMETLADCLSPTALASAETGSLSFAHQPQRKLALGME